MSYQTCPVCKGIGWNSVYTKCDVCNGKKIISEVTGKPPADKEPDCKGDH